jgi:NADP-dependent aldehyde dehydrogenase
LLRALADRLDTEVEALVALAKQETGLPEARLIGEVARTSGQLRLFATVIEEGSYQQVIIDTAASGGGVDLRRYLRSIGPVLVYAASNFPFAFSVLGGDTASALATGSAVLVKAHPSHPQLSARTSDLARAVVAELDLPVGVFAVIFGDDVGVAALRDRRIRACGFTGSSAGGRFLFDVAAARADPIPFYGELGSVNPTVLTPAAVRAREAEIAAGFVGSFTLGTGQFCTKPGLLFVPSNFDVAALAAAVTAVDAAPMLNARIATQFSDGVNQLATHDDVAEVAAGATGPQVGSWGTPHLFATSAAAVIADPEALTAEHFGPAALVVRYDDPSQLFDALGAVEGSLTATVHAEDDDPFPVLALLEGLSGKAGRVIWNGWPTGVAVAWGMNHGGPWPASTSVAYTSVGATAIARWLRPVCYQAVPEALLPPALQDANPWRLPRRVDGVMRDVGR